MKSRFDVTRLMFCTTTVLLLCTFPGCSGGDASTPKAAAATFAKAMAAGDAEAAKGVTTGADPKFVESIAVAMGKLRNLQEAAMSKFGEEGKSLGQGPTSFNADMEKSVKDSEEKITGDTATLTSKTAPSPLKLKKVDGKWKVDLSEMAPMAAMGGAMFDRMGKAATETTDEIRAGKYKSAEDAKRSLDSKIRAGMFGGATGIK